MTETVTMTVSHLLHKLKDAGHAGTLQLGEHRGSLKQLLHHLHVRLDATDEVRPSGVKLVHQLAKLGLELAADALKGEFASVLLSSPTLAEELLHELVLAILGNGFETCMQGVVVLLDEVLRRVAHCPSKVAN